MGSDRFRWADKPASRCVLRSNHVVLMVDAHIGRLPVFDVVVVVCGGGFRAKFCRADGLHSIVDDDDGNDDYVDWPGDGGGNGTGPPWWADAHDWLALFVSPTACVAYVALALVGVAVAAYRYRYYAAWLWALYCRPCLRLMMPPSYFCFCRYLKVHLTASASGYHIVQ